MKTLAFILLSATAVSAETICADAEAVRNNIATNTTQELVVFGQVDPTRIIEVYISKQDDKAFTIVTTHVAGLSCLRAFGTNAELVTPN
jgi:hypothetical protein